MVLTGRFADHLPLKGQSEAYAREGVELDVSTLADWICTCTATLAPLIELIRAHVLAGIRRMPPPIACTWPSTRPRQ